MSILKIANIIYNGELVNHHKVEYVNYIDHGVNYNDIDKSLPTLYVGWSMMKNVNSGVDYIINSTILDKVIIKNKLHWAFSFSEDKGEHVSGVEEFILNSPEYYFESQYEYIDYDPIFNNIRDIGEFFMGLPNTFKYYYQYKNDMIYLLSFDNKIYGINLKYYNYFKFNISDIVNRLKLNSEKNNIDLEGEEYIKQYKIYPNYLKLKRYMCVILSK